MLAMEHYASQIISSEISENTKSPQLLSKSYHCVNLLFKSALGLWIPVLLCLSQLILKVVQTNTADWYQSYSLAVAFNHCAIATDVRQRSFRCATGPEETNNSCLAGGGGCHLQGTLLRGSGRKLQLWNSCWNCLEERRMRIGNCENEVAIDYHAHWLVSRKSSKELGMETVPRVNASKRTSPEAGIQLKSKWAAGVYLGTDRQAKKGLLFLPQLVCLKHPKWPSVVFTDRALLVPYSKGIIC